MPGNIERIRDQRRQIIQKPVKRPKNSKRV